jgi:phosphohistidine phosphatase SixA
LKHLILMRHASAEPGEDDRARPLSADGRGEVERMARALDALGARGFRPERALVSPARRTRETLDGLRAALGGLAAEEDEALYLGSPGRLLARLQALPDAFSQALLIGHNPGLAELLDWLVGRAEADVLLRAARGLAPAACAALRIPTTRWLELEPACAELVAFVRPGDEAF